MNAATFDPAVTGLVTHTADDAQPLPLSEHYQPFDALDLAFAARFHDIEAIDRITDKLVEDGMARPRWDTSMLDQLRAGLARRYGRAS